MGDDPLQNVPSYSEWCRQNSDGKAISASLRHLSRENVPTDFGATATTAVELALQSLDGIQTHMATIRAFSNAKKKRAGRNDGPGPGLIRKSWTDIWNWIVYLHSHCIVKMSFGNPLMHTSLHTISKTIASIGWHPALRQSLIKTPGLIVMVVRHWIKEDTYVNQSELAWNKRHFAAGLENFLGAGDDETGADMDKRVLTTIAGAAGGADAVVRIALEQIQTILRLKHQEYDAISLNATLIHRFTKTTPPLRPLLIRQGLVSTFVQFLTILPARPPEGGISPDLQNCIMISNTILVQFMQTASGPSFVAQAIDAGILNGFAKAWPWIRRMGRDKSLSISAGLAEVLIEYTVYRSVLRSIAKALKKVEPAQDDLLTLQSHEWAVFKKVASIQSTLKKRFDEYSDSRLDPGFFGCENGNCRLRSEDIEYRRCAGCYVVLYCSAACQKADWPKHRAMCKYGQKALRDGSRTPLSPHDRHFVHYLAIVYLDANIPVLRNTVRETFPSTPISSLFVELIYIGVPAMSISLAADCTWDEDDEKPEMEDLLRKARADEGQKILVSVIVREGYSLAHGSMVRTYPLLACLPDGWLDE